MTAPDRNPDPFGELVSDLAQEVVEAFSREEHDLGSLEGLVAERVDWRAALLEPDTRQELAEAVLRELTGFGPLEEVMADPTVEEVMVVGHDDVFVERAGAIQPTGISFRDEDHLRNTIERILAPLGRRVDESSPMADARLPDGSRVNVVIPPLSVDGPAVSIRRFARERFRPGDLVARGTITEEEAALLGRAVAGGECILISGGTGSGKTTLLNALASFIPPTERIVTIEDAAELDLGQEHVVRLEARPENVEGRGEVTIRDLLRNALRMRPDRIVIGEVRGPEALDLLNALNTGHDGVLSTVHANSAPDALDRLELLALMAGVGLPREAIGRQFRRGIDLIVQIARQADGSRKVIGIARPGDG